VNRDPDRPRLVRQRTGDSLPDPPRRVGGDLEPPAVVVLLGRPDETEGALLNQVEKRQPLVAVVLRDRDHQPQVGLDHPLLGLERAPLDPLGQINLVLSRQQPHLPDPLQEQLQTVRRSLRLKIQRSLSAGAQGGRAFDDQAFRGGRIDLLDQLNLAALKDPAQLLDVGVLEAKLGRGTHDLGVREHPDLQPAGDQTPDLVQLLEIRS